MAVKVYADDEIGTVAKALEIFRQKLIENKEMAAATGEISKNVQEAAVGTEEVTNNVKGLTEAAGEAGRASSQVQDAAADLSRQTDTLRAEVDKFLADVKSA